MIFKVLFLNVGRRCELVEEFRRALRLRGDYCIFGSDTSVIAPALQVVDVPVILPNGDEPAFVPTLGSFLLESEIDLVIPTIDPDLVWLDRHRRELALAAPRTRLLIGPERTIALGHDKRLSRAAFLEAGLDVPRDLSADSDRSYPMFVKPPCGSASEGAEIVYDEVCLRRRLALDPSLMIEEVVPGDEITIDVLCDFSGEPLCAVPRRRIKVRGGEVAQGVVELRPDLIVAAKKAATACGATGPVTVQFRVSPNRTVAMEFNARMGGGLPLAIAAGADWPGMILDLCTGVAPTLPDHLEDGLVITRADRSFFLRPDDLAALNRRRYVAP